LILGGPGTGKSFFARSLISQAPCGTVICSASTGIAASSLQNGHTLHSLLCLPIMSEKRSKKRLECRNYRLQKELSTGVHLLLIDEISMVDATVFENVDKHL